MTLGLSQSAPITSNVFEDCILDRFGSFFDTADNQFVFKKGIGCTFTIRVVPNIVQNFTKGGSASNLCAIDLSKAFDKVNHHALFSKMMNNSFQTNCSIYWNVGYLDAIRVLIGMTHGHVCLLLVLESGKVLFCLVSFCNILGRSH